MDSAEQAEGQRRVRQLLVEPLQQRGLVKPTGMTRDEVEAMLELNAARLAADYPLLPADEIRARVAQTRDSGFALNPGLVVPDSWGLGVALRRPDGSLAGALSLAAIESRMQPPRRDALVAQLQAGARTIETTLARLHAAPSRT